jgi:hypothetical protein
MNQEIAFIEVEFSRFENIYSAYVMVKIPTEPNSNNISKHFRCSSIILVGECLVEDWGNIPTKSSNKGLRIRGVAVTSNLGWKDLHDKVDTLTTGIETTIKSIPFKQVPDSYILMVSLET